MEITATTDGKVKVVFEASIRRHLKLEDSDGISDLSTTEIFEQLALMGSKKTAWEQFSSNIATAIIFLATNRTFNFSKLIFDGMGEGSTIPVESHHTPTVAPSTSQPHHSPTLRDFIRQETEVPQPSSPTQTHVADEAASTGVDVRHGGAATTVSSLDAAQGSGNIDKTTAIPHDSPLLRVYTLGSDEGRMQHNELMDLVTKLSDRVVSLETDLQQTKKVYGAAYTKLIKKVKRLEDKLNKSRRKRRLTQGRHDHEMEADFKFTTAEDVSTANVPVNTAGAIISTASPKVNTVGVSVDDVAAKGLVYIRKSAAKRKDKAQRLQEQFDEKERQRIASIHEEASTFKPEEWDNIQAQIEADEELAHRLQAQERERYSKADKAKLLVELINERKRQFAQQRAQQMRNMPLTQAQQRSYMCNYIKHMGSHTLQQLRGYSFQLIVKFSLILELGCLDSLFCCLGGVDPSHSLDLTSAFFGVRDDSDGQIKQNLSVTPLGAATYSFSLCCSIGYCSVEESKAEDEANVEDTAYPGKEDGLDSLSFMAWAKAALMTFSEDMLIRRSQSQSLCSPLSVMWVRNPNQKSSASQWLNGSHHPPLAQTPFAALITRSRGTLLGGLHDDSQSEVFYYAIFISSKTGLGGWSQWSMKIPRRVVLSLASGITLNGIDRSSLPSSTSSGVKPAKK
ncbi:hypothetical protein Tco_1370066 [Tanacetum coccineum]